MIRTAQLHRLASLRVRDVFRLKEKSRWTTPETATVFDATRQMVNENVGSLVVVHQGKMVGIVTERDYLRKVIHAGKSSHTTRVSEIATMGKQNIVIASLDDTIQDALDAMASKDVRHLPVADAQGGILGLLSIREVAKALAKERDEAVKTLDQLAQVPIHDG